MLRTWLARLLRQLSGRRNLTKAVNRKLYQVRPALERLEDRLNLTPLTVTSAADPTVLTSGTLRFEVQQANSDAASGISDTIGFASNLLGATISLAQGQLELKAGTGTTTINGQGQVRISGQSVTRVFQVDSGAHAVLFGLGIINGNAGAGFGGGISNSGTLTVTNTTVTGCLAGFGGAGIVNFASLTLSGDVITGNAETQGEHGGGGVLSSGSTSSLTVNNNTTISDNSALFTGGGISLIDGGTLNMTNSTVTGNSSARDGGGITLQSLTANLNATLTNCTISDNACSGVFDGGGILAVNNGSGTSVTVTFTGGVIENNTAGSGAGIANLADTAAATFNVSGAVVENNTATLVDMAQNAAPGGVNGGGGILSGGSGSSLTVDTSTISGNVGDFTGGGISLINGGSLTMTSSTVIGNTSGRDGGGITLQSLNASVNATLTNCTVANNTANTGGGGILEVQNATGTSVSLLLDDCTVAGNTSGFGGGVANVSDTGAVSTLDLQNTIVAGNTATSGTAPDVEGSVNSDSSFDLIGNGTGLSGISNGSNADQIGTSTSPINAMLTPLGSYGGSTQTIALLANSPAVGAGEFDVDTDERGDSRIDVDSNDIGAYQSQPVSTLQVTAPSTVTAGVPFFLSVIALDQNGNQVFSFSGTGGLSSSDGQVVTPGTLPFNNGSTTVVVLLGTPDFLTLTANCDGFSGSSGTIGFSQGGNLIGTSVSVTSSAPSAFSGQSVTFTAAITPNAQTMDVPTGTMYFFDGLNFLGPNTGVPVTNGAATVTSSTLTVGMHAAITAAYFPDPASSKVFTGGQLSAAFTEAISPVDATQVTVSSSAPTAVAGQSVTFTAAIAPLAPNTTVPTGTVYFFDCAELHRLVVGRDGQQRYGHRDDFDPDDWRAFLRPGRLFPRFGQQQHVRPQRPVGDVYREHRRCPDVCFRRPDRRESFLVRTHVPAGPIGDVHGNHHTGECDDFGADRESVLLRRPELHRLVVGRDGQQRHGERDDFDPDGWRSFLHYRRLFPRFEQQQPFCRQRVVRTVHAGC